MSRDEVRNFDSWAINKLGIPGVVLMENAGRSCAELAAETLKETAEPRVCIFCGTGNNGGDGYVIARHLRNRGFEVVVIICGDPEKVRGDAKINLELLKGLHQPVRQLDLDGADLAEQVADLCCDCDMLVDAIFGTGLTGELRPPHKTLINCINAQGVPVLAVDIPSGLDCDTGRPLGAVVRAAHTVTFVAVKKGFQAAEAADYLGELHVASIGVEPAAKT